MTLAGRPNLPDAQKEKQGTTRAGRELPGAAISAEPLERLPPPPRRFRSVLGKVDRELIARGIPYRGDKGEVDVKGLQRLDRLNELAREAWRWFGAQSIERRTLTAGDLRGLEVLCWTWARAEQLAAEVAIEGSTVHARNGDGVIVGTYGNPKLGEMERAQAEILRWHSHFGLTPLSRQRVRTAGGTKAEENPFAAFNAMQAKLRALRGGKAGGHAQAG